MNQPLNSIRFTRIQSEDSSKDGISFGSLSTVDLLSQADVRFWAQSSCGQAAIQSLLRGQVETVCESIDRLALRASQRSTVKGKRARVIRARKLRVFKRSRWQAWRAAHAESPSDVQPLGAVSRVIVGDGRGYGATTLDITGGTRRAVSAHAGEFASTDLHRAVSLNGVHRSLTSDGWTLDELAQGVYGKVKDGCLRRPPTVRTVERVPSRVSDPVTMFIFGIAMQASAKACRAVSGGKRNKSESDSQQVNVTRWASARGTVQVKDEFHVNGKVFETQESAGWRGGNKQVGADSAADALGYAQESIAAELLRLAAGDWTRATRLCVAQFDDRTLCSARRRRSYLWRVAYRAAYRSLTQLAVGMTGRKASLYLTDLQEWGRTAADESEAERREARESMPIESMRASSFAVLPADNAVDRVKQARMLAWERLGCVHPREWLPLKGGTIEQYRTGVSQRAAVKNWRTVCLLLRGESQENALRRSGLSAVQAVNGKLRSVLAVVTV